MRRILVTLDFKGKDYKAIDVAKDLGRAFDAEIILLNVDPIEVDKQVIAQEPLMMQRAKAIQDIIEENVQEVEGKLEQIFIILDTY